MSTCKACVALDIQRPGGVIDHMYARSRPEDYAPIGAGRPQYATGTPLPARAPLISALPQPELSQQSVGQRLYAPVFYENSGPMTANPSGALEETRVPVPVVVAITLLIAGGAYYLGSR